ncbi:MAG: hypothetical protein JNJ82_11990 [Opitutaceae bacterium]|nr:hypothetical protein [Opitutaceae bacterium]
MKFYNFFPDGENSLTLVQEDGEYFESQRFVGTPMAASWKAPRLRVMGRSRKLRDFVSWDLSALVLTPRAIEALKKLIAPYVEFLSLVEVNGCELFAANVIEVVHCLDREASGITFSPDDPTRIIHIQKFVFAPERLRRVPIFKIPEWPGTIFVSEDFAQIVVDAKLAGAGFDNPEKIRYVKSLWDGTIAGLPPVREYLL